MIELHPRLDHEPEHARPDVFEVRGTIRLEVGVDGRGGGEGVGQRKLGERLLGAAGHRNFRADYVYRRFAAGALPGPLGNGAEPRRSRRHDRVGERRRIVRAGHGTIEMNLAKAGVHIVRDEPLGFLHSRLRGQILPAVRAQMIATEQHLLAPHVEPRRDLEYETAEIRGAHARVAAVLIDLIGGGLDQHGARLATGVGEQARNVRQAQRDAYARERPGLHHCREFPGYHRGSGAPRPRRATGVRRKNGETLDS